MSLVDFLKVSQEEIKKAVSGNRAEFLGGEKPTMTITQVKEQVANGIEYIIIEMGVSNCDGFNGTTYSLFLNPEKDHAKKEYIRVARLFFTDEQIMQGLAPTDLIGKTFACKMVKSERESKTYINIANMKAVDSTPDISGPAISSGIPAFL